MLTATIHVPMDMSVSLADNNSVLEQIFLQIEEEAAKRAEQEASLNNSSFASLGRSKRRTSVSVSRIGYLDVASTSIQGSNGQKRASTPFYQTRSNNASYDSFASLDELDHVNEEDEGIEDTHVTQVTTIAGRSALGSLLPKRLSRSRSETVTSTFEGGVVIGVTVKEAIVDSTQDGDVEHTGPVSHVHAPGNLSRRPSRTSSVSSPSTGSTTSAWVAKAKDISSKFKRKSKTVMEPPVLPPA